MHMLHVCKCVHVDALLHMCTRHTAYKFTDIPQHTYICDWQCLVVYHVAAPIIGTVGSGTQKRHTEEGIQVIHRGTEMHKKWQHNWMLSIKLDVCHRFCVQVPLRASAWLCASTRVHVYACPGAHFKEESVQYHSVRRYLSCSGSDYQWLPRHENTFVTAQRQTYKLCKTK